MVFTSNTEEDISKTGIFLDPVVCFVSHAIGLGGVAVANKLDELEGRP